MTRSPLSAIDGREFDVVVVGAGVNGCAASQHLAAKGYSVLLVDMGDYANGASGSSSRLLSCGIRYLAPNSSVWDFALHPRHFLAAMKNAREHMLARSEFLRTNPERVRRMDFAVPIYRSDKFQPWQVALGFKLLWQLGEKDVPLDYRFVPAADAGRYPLLSVMRPTDLVGFFLFREHYFDWPERLTIDMVLDAERLGAVTRNYTRVTAMEHESEVWSLRLHDELNPESQATVTGKIVLNFAGAWIDEVARLGPRPARRRIAAAKGVHIAVNLGEQYRGQGVMGRDRSGKYFYCFPWRDYHCFGPTWTEYSGGTDEAQPTEDEIAYLVAEAGHLFPGVRPITRSDVRYAWAGVRPLTHDPDHPERSEERTIHDFGVDGMPNLFGMTAGLLKSHRIAAREVCGLVAGRLAPSGKPLSPSYRGTAVGDDDGSPRLLPEWDARETDLLRAVHKEHATGLADAFRRVGLNWTEWMGIDAAERASHLLGGAFGWSEAERHQDLAHFLAHLQTEHAMRLQSIAASSGNPVEQRT